MNKKQKIKEMAEDLQAAEEKAGKNILKETRKFLEENARYNSKTDYIKAHVKSCFELAAETLYKVGWRKVGNDEIVVKAVEWDYLIGKKVIEHEQRENEIKVKIDLREEREDFIRKQTTKEIILELLERKENVCDNMENCFDVVTVKNIKELAEEHSIEVEE